MIVKVKDRESLPCLYWEVFYKDGIVLNSTDRDWADIPVDNVLGVIWWHELHMKGVRKKTYSIGLDYYVFVDEYLWGDTNDFEEVKDLNFKRGVWTTDEHMETAAKFIFEKLDIDG